MSGRWDDAFKSLSSAAPATALGRVHVIGVADAEVPGERIVATEGFLFRAQVAAHLLLARVVDGVLVPGEVVRAREDRVARLVGRGVDALAAVRSFLRVARRR